MEQPLSAIFFKKFNCLKLNFIIILWLLMILQFNTAYRSRLSSVLIHPPVNKVQDINELINNGYKILLHQHASKELQDSLQKIIVNR